jgi:hypothetical protein
MKEADYIVASNLAKLRMADHAVRGLYAMTGEQLSARKEILKLIGDWVVQLEREIDKAEHAHQEGEGR